MKSVMRYRTAIIEIPKRPEKFESCTMGPKNGENTESSVAMNKT